MSEDELALLELIREFDERGGWCGPGLASCAHWLNWKCGINLCAAADAEDRESGDDSAETSPPGRAGNHHADHHSPVVRGPNG